MGFLWVAISSLTMSDNQLMAFDEIIPSASVRFAVVDGIQYLSIRDLIMVMCGKDGNQAAEIWRRLSDFKKEEVKALR